MGRLLYGAMESIQTTSELPRWRRRRRGGGGGAVEAMATGKEGIADLDGEERRGEESGLRPPPRRRRRREEMRVLDFSVLARARRGDRPDQRPDRPRSGDHGAGSRGRARADGIHRAVAYVDEFSKERKRERERERERESSVAAWCRRHHTTTATTIIVIIVTAAIFTDT